LFISSQYFIFVTVNTLYTITNPSAASYGEITLSHFDRCVKYVSQGSRGGHSHAVRMISTRPVLILRWCRLRTRSGQIYSKGDCR